MVRVFLKGGIWKNSEDEILKAAVQKYGKQQWARVASLLNRKSAKQSKARWYEWLDPSIRKIEWSTQEEEKLLHLAKLMPAQWKTIASIIGRTATQCQEHYEYLLDQAAAANAATTSAGDGTGTGGNSANDLRVAANAQLRVGQIDSNPESKPARPDPIDMDEDEMEMLQEARARLANTQGKKAKRKQRERMLLAAKRLADLQKRRELKQAGLLSKAAMKKSKLSKRNIDYGVEIPFHKPAPAGFHDITTENIRTEQVRMKRGQQVNYHQVNEQQFRSRDQEAASIRKKEQSRIKMLQKTNDKYINMIKSHEQQQTDQSDVKQIRPLQPLDLPEPTITDTELLQLAKLHQTYQNQSNDTNTLLLEDGVGAGVTTSLIGDYTNSNQSIVTSMITAATTGTNNNSVRGKQQHQPTLMEQATKLRQLERSSAPLLVNENEDETMMDTSENADMNEYDEGDDMDRKPAATATKSSKKSITGETTTSRYSVFTQTTVLRDQFGLNLSDVGVATTTAPTVLVDGTSSIASYGGTSRRNSTSGIINNNNDDTGSVGLSTLGGMSFGKFSIRDLARQQRRAAKRARIELDKAFATLPIPQYEYELAMQNTDMNNNDDDDEMPNKILVEPDRADLEAAEQEQLRIDAVKLYETRNSVLKRIDLPRPVMNSKKIVQSIIVVEDADDVHDKYSNIAVLMIRKEMQILLQHDASNFPITRNSSNNNNDVLSQQTKKKKKDDKKKKKRKHEPQGGGDDDIQPYSPQNVVLDVIPENELDAAKKAVSIEYATLISEKIAKVMNANIATNRHDALEFLANENYKVANQYATSMTYDDQKGWITSTPNDDNVELEYKTLMNAIEELKKKNDKLEIKKIHVMTNGYIQIRKKLIDDIHELYSKLQKEYSNEYIYYNLNIQEIKSGNQRIVELQNKINHVKTINLHMQHNYGNLLVQKRKLLLKQQQQEVPASS